MRIFRMKPNISAILSRCDSKEEKKFISHVANSCFKRFMNISKMEKEIHTQLTKSEINLQSKILGDFIHSLSSTPRGEEIARDMYVASARSIQKIDVEAALSFSEKLLTSFLLLEISIIYICNLYIYIYMYIYIYINILLDLRFGIF